MLCGIKSSEVHLALQLGRRIGPGRRQVLTVTAPGRIELDEEVLEVLHRLVVVLLRQHVDALVLLNLEAGLQMDRSPSEGIQWMEGWVI